jgi:UPF0716 family protein affecting phage T7 exclusion
MMLWIPFLRRVVWKWWKPRAWVGLKRKGKKKKEGKKKQKKKEKEEKKEGKKKEGKRKKEEEMEGGKRKKKQGMKKEKEEEELFLVDWNLEKEARTMSTDFRRGEESDRG